MGKKLFLTYKIFRSKQKIHSY